MAPSTLNDATRELAHRVGGGIEVTLLWNPVDDCTSIELWHEATGQAFRLAVPAELALDAFYHPLLYVQTEGAA
jgi:hypothetical protein